MEGPSQLRSSEKESPGRASGELTGSWSLNQGHRRPWFLRPHIAGTVTVLPDLSKPLCHHCLVTLDKNLLREHVPSLPLYLHPMSYPNLNPQVLSGRDREVAG